MKIIHVLSELKYSGAEIMYVDAAPVFQKLGCKLIVVNTAKQLGEYALFFEKAGYEVMHKEIPHSLFAQWKMRKEIMRLINRVEGDILHIHRADLRWIMSYCAWRTGRKSIYTTHNVFRSNWYSYPLHFMLRWSAHHLFHCTFQTISDAVDENERNYYHTKTTLIYNWYGNKRFYPASKEEKEQTRRELNIPQDALVVISVGGCSHVKRHHDVIKAMAEIVKQYKNVIYLHLGQGTTLDEEKELATSLNISDKIRFCGNQSNVRKYLIASDIYVMPSRHEGIPITTIESMACKIPAILYNVPGLKDFNKENECSILIPEDPHQLSEAIIALYKNLTKQKLLAENAKALVDSKFNMEKNVKQIYALYCE